MGEIYEKMRKPIWDKFLKKAGWHGTQTLHWKRPLFSRDRQGDAGAGASVEVTGISPHGFYFLSVVRRRKVTVWERARAEGDLESFREMRRHLDTE